MKIFALSDQHGYTNFKLPEADLYLHAGDVARDYYPGHPYGSTLQEAWLKEEWAPKFASSKMLATFGNHDFVRKQEAPRRFYVDEAVEWDGLKIWFSPWSPQFNNWAWMKPDADLAANYAAIPADIDIIVSHCPPYGYGDTVDEQHWIRHDEDPHLGSKSLLAAINRLKPKAVICGHIHSGWGQYRHKLPPGEDPTYPFEGEERGIPDKFTYIYNVSLVDEDYKLVHPPTEIIL